jgi:hypothetical protein
MLHSNRVWNSDGVQMVGFSPALPACCTLPGDAP